MECGGLAAAFTEQPAPHKFARKRGAVTLAFLGVNGSAELSLHGVLEALLKQSPDSLLSSPFIHHTSVHIGDSAFAVNQRR
jgi:hypothetical protein